MEGGGSVLWLHHDRRLGKARGDECFWNEDWSPMVDMEAVESLSHNDAVEPPILRLAEGIYPL